jgi:hypothetical protein
VGRYMLPEFSKGGYQVVWWFMVGIYVVIAIIVILVAGPKRLVTRLGSGVDDVRHARQG